MRLNTSDLTLARNYLSKYQFLIKEYELVKQKLHPNFKYAKDFYYFHGTCAKTFLKYYSRYKQSGDEASLIPAKRGPKYKTRRPLPFIENKVKQEREKGNSRYEIVSILRPKLKQLTPSPSGVYNICKRLGLNKLTKKSFENKRRIVKEKLGQLGNLDCHYLSKNILENHPKGIRLYLVCLVDAYSRLAHVELTTSLTSLEVMFASLSCINQLKLRYHIQFEEILTDNGPEFGSKHFSLESKNKNPFERMLQKLEIKHRYTRPYRPQTNGKVERFWRTIEEDLLREATYKDVDTLKFELEQYLYYYNHMRPHQGLNGKVPVELIGLTPTTEEDLVKEFSEKVLPN